LPILGTRALQHQVHAQRAPVDGFRGRLTQYLHAVAIYMQAIAVHAHLAGKATMGGIEAGQVLQAGHVGQIVERDDLEPERRAALVEGAQHAAADTAVAVEGDAVGTGVGHGIFVGPAGGKPLRGFTTYGRWSYVGWMTEVIHRIAALSPPAALQPPRGCFRR